MKTKYLLVFVSTLLLAGCSSKTSQSSVPDNASNQNQKTTIKVQVKDNSKKEESSKKNLKEEDKTKTSKSKPSENHKESTEKKSSAVSSNEHKTTVQPDAVQSDSSGSQSQEHVHDWVWIDPPSHTKDVVVVDQDAYDETVVDKPEWYEYIDWIVCNGCGYKTTDREAFGEHAAFSDANPACGSYHIDTEISVVHPAETHTVHHDAVTHTIQIEVADFFGYYKCSTCGAENIVY